MSIELEKTLECNGKAYINSAALISGPSGVGKGPMIKTLNDYANANNIKIHKHVLYVNEEQRKRRLGETDGIDYHFLKTVEELLLRADANPDGFIVFDVNGQLQGIDIDKLENELKEYERVLIEIYYTQAPMIATKCAQRGIPLKSVFIKPFSDKDYQNIGCVDDDQRGLATKAAMLTKLMNRGTETDESVVRRASGAYKEIKEHKGYDKDLLNHFGEDNRYLWNLLQEKVKIPGGLEDALNDELLKNIAKTFKDFLSAIGI